MCSVQAEKLRKYCFVFQGSTPRSSLRLSLIRQRLRIQLFQKQQRQKSECAKFTDVYEQWQPEVNCLQVLKERVESLQLGIHSEVELVSSGRNTTLLSVSSTCEKNYSEQLGPYGEVKLLIAPLGSYEVRVNVVDCAETGKVDFDNETWLRELISKISSKSEYKICPGLTKAHKYEDLPRKSGYRPKNVFFQW